MTLWRSMPTCWIAASSCDVDLEEITIVCSTGLKAESAPVWAAPTDDVARTAGSTHAAIRVVSIVIKSADENALALNENSYSARRATTGSIELLDRAGKRLARPTNASN